MDTSLYISNERIAAVTGDDAGKRFRVSRFASVPLPEGAVLGGVITDDRAMADALTTLRESMQGSLRSVRLVLGSSKIYLKRSVVPKSGKKKLMEWVKSEFSDVETADDDTLIFDYMLLSDLGPDKGDSALLCAANKSLVASYAELMENAKVKLSCMDTTLSALQKLLRFLPATAESTCIVLSFDGNMLDATLFVKGEYRFSNRTRLIASRGTAESTAEISRTVSSLNQFNLSERSGEAIAAVYVIGARQDEAAMMASIAGAYDLPVAPLSDPDGTVIASEGFVLSDYAFAVGNLIGR